MDRGNWMQTYTGRKYYPLHPRPDEVNIIDIAHALSMMTRYNGHTMKFYSIAEHCCLLHDVLPNEHKLVGLMHDATEAYTCDMPRPLKQAVPGYKEIENRNWGAICRHFNMPEHEPVILKELDLRICLDERNALMTRTDLDWGISAPLGIKIHAWDPDEAKAEFLKRYIRLRG